MIQKYDIIQSGSDKVGFKRVALPAGTVANAKYLPTRKRLYQDTFIVDKVTGQRIDRRKLIQLLEDHICENYIRLDGRWYRQRVGIPQGSILSPLLCSFFYGALDHEYLPHFLVDQNSLYIRFIDDILFITPDVTQAQLFLSSIIGGFSDYGVHINKSKVLCNFANTEKIPVAGDREWFHWCGLGISSYKLQIRGDFSKFYHNSIADSMTIDYGSASDPHVALENFMLIYLRPKLHPIFFDSKINQDIHVVASNIYRNAIHVAMKLHTYIKETDQNRQVFYKDVRLWEMLTSITEKVEKQIRMKCLHPIIQATHLSQALLYRGFYEVLKRRPSRYANYLLPMLKHKCTNAMPLSLLYGHEMEEIVINSGHPLLINIKF